MHGALFVPIEVAPEWTELPLRILREKKGKIMGDSACLTMNNIGKPYSGKPNVRFDEGELEIEQSATTPVFYSTEVWQVCQK